MHDANKNCYRSHYGVGEGRAWDMTCNPSCALGASDRAGWCDEPWCYVNATECRRKKTGKTVKETDIIFGGEGRAFYSYKTCGGNGESWSTFLIEAQVKGKQLTVGIPKSFFPEQLMVDSRCSSRPLGLKRRATGFSPPP